MFDVFKQFVDYCNDSLRFYRAVYELSQLSNKDLKELGINRSEITLVAMEASINAK